MALVDQIRQYDAPKRNDFSFNGAAFEYFKIWIVNIVLSILTLGIFSAWAKVRRKRYFYNNTEFCGASFDYHAKPIRILIGRIIVIGGYVVLSLLATVFPFIGGLVTIIFIFALPVIVNSSLRFNARNSSYRNIRFRYISGYWSTFIVFVVFSFLSSITLGLFCPYQVYAIKNHIIRKSSYGTQKFDFRGHPITFYKIYFFGLIFAIIVLGLMTVQSIYLATVLEKITSGSGIEAGLAPFMPLFIIVIAVSGVGIYFVISFVNVCQTNYIFDNMFIVNHGFESHMKVKKYLGISIVNTLGIIFTLGLLRPWAVIRETKYRLENLRLYTISDIDGCIAAEDENVKALGEEFGDFFDFDLGL